MENKSLSVDKNKKKKNCDGEDNVSQSSIASTSTDQSSIASVTEFSSSTPETVLNIDLSPINSTDDLNPEQQAFLEGEPLEVRQKTLDDKLLHSLKYDEDVKEVERLLREGANPNAVDDHGLSACHWAALWDDRSLSVLIEHGGLGMKSDEYGLTPLHLAAHAGNVKQIAILLGFPKELQNRIRVKINERTVEHIQQLRPQVQDMVNLVIKGDDIKQFKEKYKNVFHDRFDHVLIRLIPGGTPLHLASFYAHSHSVRLLLAAGADARARDAFDRTPLDIAGLANFKDEDIGNFTDVIKMLIEANNSNFFKKPTVLCSPLHVAVALENLEAVRILVEAGMPVNWLDEEGDTPLHLCVKMQFPKAADCLKILFKGKCEDENERTINVRDKLDCTVLHKAILKSWKPGVIVALENGAGITVPDSFGNTPLHCAAIVGNEDILNIILRKAKIKLINSGNKSDETPLHLSVYHGHVKCVERLLEDGATLDTVDGEGYNLLHMAASLGYIDTFKALYDYNDKITNRMKKQLSDDGNSVMDVACQCGNVDVIKLLLEEDDAAFLSVDNVHTIIDKAHKPTEILEEIFDFYIYTDDHNENDEYYEVTVDYTVLLGNNDAADQMKVVNAIVASGNSHDQKRLLLHPLVQSFLHLKWQQLQPLFILIFLFYSLFTVSLSIYIHNEFCVPNSEAVVNTTPYAIISLLSTVIILAQELRYVSFRGWRHYLLLETWMRLLPICLAMILIVSVTIVGVRGSIWTRHVASVTILLSWFEMMLLTSRFPFFGYYVPMFGKVAYNVIKILVIFSFLIVGFALSFLLQFNSSPPFDDFGAAFMKTLVMMASEFDYGDFNTDHGSEDFASSIIVIRILFVAFVIFVPIVLMNLLLAVAVSDIQTLEKKGNIVRLEKRIEFILSLNHQPLKQKYKLFPNNKKKDEVKFPEDIREDIFKIARKDDDDEVKNNDKLADKIYVTKNIKSEHKEIVSRTNKNSKSKDKAIDGSSVPHNKEMKHFNNRISKIESELTEMHTKLDSLCNVLLKNPKLKSKS